MTIALQRSMHLVLALVVTFAFTFAIAANQALATDELEIEVEIHNGETHVHVEYEDGEEDSFFLEADITDTEAVIDEVVAETGLDRSDVEDVIEFEDEDEDEEHGNKHDDDEDGDDHDKGHGNDDDGCDEDNPGKSRDCSTYNKVVLTDEEQAAADIADAESLVAALITALEDEAADASSTIASTTIQDAEEALAFAQDDIADAKTAEEAEDWETAQDEADSASDFAKDGLDLLGVDYDEEEEEVELDYSSTSLDADKVEKIKGLQKQIQKLLAQLIALLAAQSS